MPKADPGVSAQLGDNTIIRIDRTISIPRIYDAEPTLSQPAEHILRRLQKLLGCLRKDGQTGAIMSFAFTLESALGDDQEWFAIIRFLEVEEVGVGAGSYGLAVICIGHKHHLLSIIMHLSQIVISASISLEMTSEESRLRQIKITHMLRHLLPIMECFNI